MFLIPLPFITFCKALYQVSPTPSLTAGIYSGTAVVLGSFILFVSFVFYLYMNYILIMLGYF